MAKILDKVDGPPMAAGDPARPTHARYWVIVFAASLAIITYIDRICIAQAAPLITNDLGLTKTQMGWAFSVFLWAYALFEVPGGWLGDRLGARRVLMRVVVWWSFFTAATGWVWSYPSLLVTRTLFGAGEAGCFPNLTKAFTTWLPVRERVRAQGFMWLAARWGGAFTPLLVAFTLRFVSWRRAFEIFGALGIIWALIFYRWYRDNPREHKSVNEAESAILPPAESLTAGHGPVPWGKFVRSRTVWLLWLQYFVLTYGWTFYITWLPTYLKEARHVELGTGALLAGMPLFFGGLGCIFCGYISGYLVRRIGSVTATRRWLAGIGFSGAGLLLVLSINIQDPVWAMVAMGFASFSNDLVMPPAWGTCMDVGGKYTGTLSGSMNMMGNFGGALASVITGYILDHTARNWTIPLYLAAALYFVGTFCWLLIDPVTPLEDSKSTA
ncbi:MAG TPA: MFS transporter [Blastocatellia bacterium]|jgi:MFS family permease|nr:MFS transporter [Blastocatellia bacterium]